MDTYKFICPEGMQLQVEINQVEDFSLFVSFHFGAF